MPRRPLLATAVVVGASRSAARREVEQQKMRDAEIQREAERSRTEEQRREAQTQMAINEAVRQETERQQQRSQLATNQAVAPPAYPNYAYDGQKSNASYCPACGNACKHEDKFCSGCGRRRS